MKRLKISAFQAGVSLVELLVSVAIGLVILAGVLQLYVSSVNNEQSQSGISRIQENVRYIFSRLEYDIANSGFTGCLPLQPDRIVNVLGLNIGLGDTADYSSYISGTNDDGLLASDTFTVKYSSFASSVPIDRMVGDTTSDFVVDSSVAAFGQLEQYQIAVASDCSRTAIFMITNAPAANSVGPDQALIEHAPGVTAPADGINEGQFNTDAELQNMFGQDTPAALYFGGSGGTQSFVYSIGTSAAADAAGLECENDAPENCALFRNDNELAEGVQSMQVEYGEQSAAGDTVFYRDADDIVDWLAIDRIRVTLDFNSIDEVPTNGGSSGPSGPSGPSGSGTELMVRTMSKTIMVRNQLPID